MRKRFIFVLVLCAVLCVVYLGDANNYQIYGVPIAPSLLVQDVQTIAADDTTPDVSIGIVFITSENTGATAITDLDLPVVGQYLTIIGGSDTYSSTIADGGNFNLDRGYIARLDSSITLFVQADNDYIETGRSSPVEHLMFNVFNPNSVQSADAEVCVWPKTDAALTITKIIVTLDTASEEIAGDLKYADTFIGLASPVVINVFDTSSGVLEDGTITSGSVAAGKCIYISFDSAPDAAITQAAFVVEFYYD